MKSSNTNQLILKNLDCDALLEGTITEFKNNFYVAYSSTNVGLSLFLKDKNNQVLSNQVIQQNQEQVQYLFSNRISYRFILSVK